MEPNERVRENAVRQPEILRRPDTGIPDGRPVARYSRTSRLRTVG